MWGVGESGDFVLNLLAGAGAGINEFERLEQGEGILVGGEAGGLFPRIGLPRKAEPREVIEELLIIFGTGAGVVDVLKTEEHRAVILLGEIEGNRSGVGVAEVEDAGGAGGETGDGHAVFILLEK